MKIKILEHNFNKFLWALMLMNKPKSHALSVLVSCKFSYFEFQNGLQDTFCLCLAHAVCC